ncbi:MAG: hypothetical protein KAJ23_17590 [Maribacter sp.]|nr:hypothetical protein [Maribacter sp.]
MKYLTMAFLVLSMNSYCSGQNQDRTTQFSVTYKAATRGANFEYRITNERIAVNSKGLDQKNGERAITTQERNEIIALINKINLSTIGTLIPPSNNSATDRALIASLKVSKDGKMYESSSFDEGNPPKEIKPLIDKIVALAETVE